MECAWHIYNYSYVAHIIILHVCKLGWLGDYHVTCVNQSFFIINQLTTIWIEMTILYEPEISTAGHYEPEIPTASHYEFKN